jgi:3-hydroxyacyl-CoA dehydrogenase
VYQIRQAAVIGAGTMGLGIAGQLANAGVPVLLLDRPASGADRNAIARRAIERLLDDQQPGLLHPDFAERITLGNIEDDLERLGQCDWIAEAVVERLDVKRALYRQIDAHRKQGSMVTSNTSTIPISLLVAEMPPAFRREFAITHFFNPVRFMRLLELVRGEDTLPAVVGSLEAFCEARLGKGIVVCRDTPGFLGNRVGVFAIQTALHQAFAMGLRPEQADAVFGRPMGVPKTGVFGLYDLIGIDLMADVARSLVDILPPDDEFHRVSTEIPLMARMIEAGRTGNKSDQGGFYRQFEGSEGPVRQTLDFEQFDYRDHDRAVPEIAARAELAGDLAMLVGSDEIASRYAWEVMSQTLCYAAALVPEVNDSLVAIDDAMKLGYNWLRGPFEMIDALGVDGFIQRLEREGRHVPVFLQAAAGRSFYRVSSGQLQFLGADGEYHAIRRAPGIRRFSEERRTRRVLGSNAVASFYDIGEELGLVEWHSKANTLDGDCMSLLDEAVAHATEQFRGLVIHNDAAHFSCGVNLAAVLDFITREDFDGLDRFLAHFQQTVQRMRYAPIPVVAAPVGLALGGGFEVVLHTDRAIYHANSVTGLVESLVGVVPGGGGVKEMLYRYLELEGDAPRAAWKTFMQIGYGRTASSPLLASELAMFRKDRDEFLMNRDRMLARACAAALEMAGSYTVERRAPIAVAGRDAWAEMVAWLEKAHGKGQLTPHDVTTGTQIAMIVCGGDVAAGTMLGEDDLTALERKAFVSLAQTPETRARIAHMLEFGSPLRN